MTSFLVSVRMWLYYLCVCDNIISEVHAWFHYLCVCACACAFVCVWTTCLSSRSLWLYCLWKKVYHLNQPAIFGDGFHNSHWRRAAYSFSESIFVRTCFCLCAYVCVCARAGSWNLDSSIGIYAADPESYSVFADIFDPVIKDYHRLKQSEAITHPEPDFGNLEQLDLSGLDPDSEMIVSTRIRVGRSHMGYPFPPALTKEVVRFCFLLT